MLSGEHFNRLLFCGWHNSSLKGKKNVFLMQSKQITGWSQISHQFWLHVTTNQMVHVNFSAFILKHMQVFLLRNSQCVLYEKNNHLSFPSSSFSDQLLIVSSVLLKQAWSHTVAWLKLECIKCCIVSCDTFIGDVNLRGGKAMIFFFVFVSAACN
jgi:hypothetical protein